MSKNEFMVELPIAGKATIFVEAESEEEAKDIAYANLTIDHIEEWEPMDHITEGNVCYAPFWSIEISDNGPVDGPFPVNTSPAQTEKAGK